ncbi:MAG TPA: ferritin-like domain-containing protein [Terracidiphilus sp.]|jgi:fatty aldehyde decarbonylase
MDSLVSLNCREAAVSNSPLATASIWQDVLAQAVTGELMAAMNYNALSTICDDPDEVADALEHAHGEEGHAAAFAAEGLKIGVDVPNNVNARYWKRIRESFMRSIGERDFIACLIVQEIMLESFAVASYTRIGKAAPGSLGRTFAAIAAEEEGHIDHAMDILRSERDGAPQRFDDKVYRLHLDVMTTLTEMVAKECRHGQCELCHSACVKPSLSEVGLSTAELRGASLQQYLKALDTLGLPGEVTLQWVAQLPV